MPRHKKHRVAFTLVELLLALSITALIGVAVVSMMEALSYGTASRQSMRELLVKANTIGARLSSAARRSKEVVAATTDYTVLWVEDENDDDGKQNNEMQLIQRDSSTDELFSYSNDADTTGFVSAASFRALAVSSYPSQRWATDVTALAFFPSSSASGTILLNHRVTVSGELLSETSIGATGLRQ